MKLLVAVDGSDISEGALQFYLNSIHKEGNEVVLAHVTENISHPFGFKGVSKEDWEKMQKEHEAKIQAINDHHSAVLKQKNIECKFVHETGEPGHHIVSMATAEQVQLIVMGTRGLGSVRRTILGSVSDYVLHHAHVPVVICRK